VNLRYSAAVGGRKDEGEQRNRTDSDNAKPRPGQSTLILAAGRKEQYGSRREQEAGNRQWPGTPDEQEECEACRGDGPDAQEWIHDSLLTFVEIRMPVAYPVSSRAARGICCSAKSNNCEKQIPRSSE
jgi:hypothetical protein